MTRPVSADPPWNIGDRDALGESGERRAYAAAYESLTFPFVTRGRREMTVTLSSQPVFDLSKSEPVSRRIRRIVRHRGGEQALFGLGRRTLEAVDLRRIDLQTLTHGMELMRLGGEQSGVIPAFWRTVATSHGRFALLYAGLQHESAPGLTLIEVTGADAAGSGALAQTIAHFETERLGVILHVAPDAGLARRLAGSNARCLAMDFAGVDHDSPRAWEAASALIGAAREAAPGVMLINLRPEWAKAAHGAGATHAVFARMDPFTI